MWKLQRLTKLDDNSLEQSMNPRPNRETLLQYQALDKSLENMHTVLRVCELERREVITQQVLDLVWTVHGIKESIIEDPVSVLSLPSRDQISSHGGSSIPSPMVNVPLPLPEFATDTSLASPEVAMVTSLPSPEVAQTSSQASPEVALATSQASPEVALATSQASPEVAPGTSQASPEVALITSQTSPEVAPDTPQASPEVAQDTSPANRNLSLCRPLAAGLEPSAKSPQSSASKGGHVTLVNTVPLTQVSNHTPFTPTSFTPTTGILPFFKLAGQKIASLKQRSSPCKNTCTYHAQRQKDFKLQLIHGKRTDNPTDSNAKQIPMNERVTLPPRPTTDEVITPSPPSVLTCKPFLCSNSWTPSKAPVAEISQETPVRKGVLKLNQTSSSHGSSAHQSQTLLKWKSSFLKTHSPNMKKTKPIKLIPDTRTDSWGKLSKAGPAPFSLVIRSNEKTVPRVKDMDSSRLFDDLSDTRSTSSIQPWRSASKSKSLLPPLVTSPESQRLSEISRGIRGRTINTDILMMNESEEGENTFGSGFWEIRTALPETHSMYIVTEIREGAAKPDVLPSTLYLPQTEELSHALPTFESAKRKLFYNENKSVPMKKRFNPNFSETSKHASPHKNPVLQGKPGTPKVKQITPRKKSGFNGKPYTPKVKQITPKKKSGFNGKPYTPEVKQITPKQKSGFNEKPYTPNEKSRVCGKQQVPPRRKYPKERKSCVEETSRTSRARQPMQSPTVKEELVHQLEGILRVFMEGGKQATTKMLPTDKQEQLIEFSTLCYITAVKTTGGVRLRKTSSSRAPIPLDREWMLS